MSDSLQAATGRVALELPIAGLGSRAMAWLVDSALLFAVALITYFIVTFFVTDPLNVVLELAASLKAGIGAGVLLLLWSYWTIFELRWNGQSPGKRLMRIRVVRSDGSPVTLYASATRNLLRMVDFFPACYPVGAAVMLADSKHRRLGDLLAGTVLVRDERVDLSKYAQTNSELEVDVLEVATSWLARWAQLEPEPRDRIGRKLLQKLGGEAAASGEALRDEIRARVTKK